MIRVNRSFAAGALLAGAVLMSVAPAQAQAPAASQAIELQPIETQAADTQPIGNRGIASGSADLNNFFCGTLWRPVCYPNGLPY